MRSLSIMNAIRMAQTTAADPTQRLPRYRDFVARSGLTPSGYYRPPFSTGSIKSEGNGSDPALAPTGTPSYDYFANGYRGVMMVADGDRFNVTGFEPGVASMIWTFAFTVPADVGLRSLGGKGAPGDPVWFAQVLANDKIGVYISDGTGQGNAAAGDTGQVISYGLTHHYLFSMMLDRRALAYPAGRVLRTRLSKFGSGLVGAEYAGLDITAYGTLSGGTTPKSGIGSVAAVMDGSGIVHLGALNLSGAQIEYDGVLKTIATACGAE